MDFVQALARPNRVGDPALKLTKWVLDTAFVLFGGLAAVMVALVLCVLNPNLNPGPILFFQDRVGLDGRPFRIWKFRTLPTGTALSKNAVDPQTIPALGRFLRRLHLDELPQVVNVLRGEMCVIGPRPEQVHLARAYRQALVRYDHRHAVKPGITGLAQISVGYTDDLEGTENKLSFDLRYISNQNWALELYIVWQTVVLLTREFTQRK